ncbi:MAG TPA: S-adenosylmethionine:tRNA ribosyltransferase-isomerase [Acidimicrobiales bacterium]|nr:S-adenosylmethionine:tRNA ribosyltransferase-isomerase [Acidimicrobiales bacterium]
MSPVLAAPPGLSMADVLPVDFELPDDLIATEPVEAAGGGREDARLMVARRSHESLVHTTFSQVGSFLDPGDLLVVNTSATLPAAVPGVGPDDGLLVHLSTELPGGLWLVELRRPDGAGTRPFLDGRACRTVSLPGGASVELLAPYPADGSPTAPPVRLWFAVLRLPLTLTAYLGRFGRPIRYGYARRPFPLSAYQTVFAGEPGSAEMPSAGRPFTAGLVTELVSRGVGIAPIVLHTGVSSAEPGEMPYPERYRVPLATAARVNAARGAGHRVVAVGTTVTRALETAADERGRVHPSEGWTELVVTPERGARVVDGLITGWHQPAGSHLLLVEAVAGRTTVERSYAAAVEGRYRWHEFGDVHLILP